MLRALTTGRTGADDKLVAEMLKTGHRGLAEALAAFLDGISQDDLEAQETWEKTKFKGIFKKGDPGLPGNYRPISIITVCVSFTAPYCTCEFAKYWTAASQMISLA